MGVDCGGGHCQVITAARQESCSCWCEVWTVPEACASYAVQALEMVGDGVPQRVAWPCQPGSGVQAFAGKPGHPVESACCQKFPLAGVFGQ